MLKSRLAAIAVLVVASGCAFDAPTSAPETPSSQLAPSASASSTRLGAPVKAKPLLRNESLHGKISVSRSIGIWGGVLTIPNAGVTLVVPPFAVDHETTITMTAQSGPQVAYEFEPHGTNFRVPLLLTQDLRGTSGGVTQVGYFGDPGDPLTVSELLNANVNLGRHEAVSTIWHFSGYIYMSGRE